MTRRFAPTRVFAALTMLVVAAFAVGGGATAASQAEPLTDKVIFFASDGMRPDLVDKYAAAGAMPTMAHLMSSGVKGQNGLLQGFPPNTGVGWSILATGTWPGEHGSTNNTFFRQGESSFNNRSSFADTGIVQADHIARPLSVQERRSWPSSRSRPAR